MGDAFIVRRGGMADAFAVIAVAYPEGSVCTCSKGTKTLRAKDTSGSFLFLIPEAGTWTVICTDGTKTATKNVVIDTQYQAENISLAYSFYLFKSGEGWKVPRGTFADGTDYVTISDRGYYTELTIDMSPYSSINIDYISRCTESDNYGTYWGLGPDNSTGHAGGGNWTCRGLIGQTERNQRVVKSLSFNSLPSTVYFKIYETYTSGSPMYNLWLE